MIPYDADTSLETLSLAFSRATDSFVKIQTSGNLKTQWDLPISGGDSSASTQQCIHYALSGQTLDVTTHIHLDKADAISGDNKCIIAVPFAFYSNLTQSQLSCQLNQRVIQIRQYNTQGSYGVTGKPYTDQFGNPTYAYVPETSSRATGGANLYTGLQDVDD